MTTKPFLTPNNETGDQPSETEKFYGRRMGRPLRQNTKALVDKALPTYTFDDNYVTDPHGDFDQDAQELWLEIGCGGGEHLCAQARANPNINMIGAEAFMNGISLMLRQILDEDIDNIRIWPNDVRPLLDRLPDNCVDRLFLLFPDPWPKARHHKRRFINERNLERIIRVLKPGALFRVATDHSDYRAWICDHMKPCKTLKPQFSWDVLPTEQPNEWVPTRYETKALSSNITCTYLDFLCQKD